MVLINNLVQVFYTILTHISHFRYIDDEVSSIDDINWGLFTALFIFVQISWAMLCILGSQAGAVKPERTNKGWW